jgi:hypothetical protein
MRNWQRVKCIFAIGLPLNRKIDAVRRPAFRWDQAFASPARMERIRCPLPARIILAPKRYAASRSNAALPMRIFRFLAAYGQTAAYLRMNINEWHDKLTTGQRNDGHDCLPEGSAAIED